MNIENSATDQNLNNNSTVQAQTLNLQMSHINQGVQDLPTEFKFLFVLEPKDLARQACCGLSLKAGVQIISIVFLFSTTLNFIASLYKVDLIDLILTGVTFLLYLVAAICIFLSTNSKDPHYAATGYTIYATLFILSLLNSLTTAVLIFLGIFRPFATNDKFRSGLVYSFASAIVLGVHLYLVWIIYSYSAHLRMGRINLIEGDIYKDYNENKEGNTNVIIEPQ